jgi:4-hydroxythreonine-4-phosphate dehydrogenase
MATHLWGYSFFPLIFFQHMTLPLLLTMGDACGIGPEIICRSFQLNLAMPAVVLGDVAVMRRAAELVGGMVIAQIEHPQDVHHCPPQCVPVLQAKGLPADLIQAPVSQIDARAGTAAYACIAQAVQWVQAGQASAIVTAPIHKGALAAAGIGFSGHTEMLQALSVTPGQDLPPVRMMLANDELRVVLVTIHVSLRQAIEQITFEAVLETLRIAHQSARQFGVAQPRLAVAALNPHAGEGGLFGDEELRIIAPAIAAAQAQGINATGPYAPDTVFMRARDTPNHPGEFDLVVAMTHDHGLIPVKYLGLEQGVNITLGLPFARTSPDHGTAFDIAGTGRADAQSFVAAMRMAKKMRV